MKKLIKVVAIIASVMLTLSFIACSNPSSSDSNSNDTNDTNTTETTTEETANPSNNAEDPFAGTTWEEDTGNMGIVITTIKFSNNKTVDYYMTTSGTKTSLYSGPYEVTKNYLDVEGQYGASVGFQTFVIPNKDATSVSWGGKTFIKK